VATWAAEKVTSPLSLLLPILLLTYILDGYTSLLIEEEGGVAKEIVSEENGVLISTILRQYFMSLKVMGKWKRWGKSMEGRFATIQTNLQKGSHGFHDPSPTSPTMSAKNSTSREQENQRGKNEVGDGEEDPDISEDEDDGPMYDGRVPIQFSDKQTEMIRRVMKKWWRVAGLKGIPKACDELGGSEFEVNWTKAIAPRVEGRIREIGGGMKTEE
jgi:5'-nucleotidase